MAKRVTAPKILLLLSDGKSRSSREIRKEIGLSRDAIGSSLIRLWEILKVKGIKPCDIMSNVRRFERNGLVNVRGYRMHDKQTPFKEGYLLTWIDSGKSREQAIEDAIKKTTLVLENKSSPINSRPKIHKQ